MNVQEIDQQLAELTKDGTTSLLREDLVSDSLPGKGPLKLNIGNTAIAEIIEQNRALLIQAAYSHGALLIESKSSSALPGEELIHRGASDKCWHTDKKQRSGNVSIVSGDRNVPIGLATKEKVGAALLTHLPVLELAHVPPDVSACFHLNENIKNTQKEVEDANNALCKAAVTLLGGLYQTFILDPRRNEHQTSNRFWSFLQAMNKDADAHWITMSDDRSQNALLLSETICHAKGLGDLYDKPERGSLKRGFLEPTEDTKTAIAALLAQN